MIVKRKGENNHLSRGEARKKRGGTRRELMNKNWIRGTVRGERANDCEGHIYLTVPQKSAEGVILGNPVEDERDSGLKPNTISL